MHHFIVDELGPVHHWFLLTCFGDFKEKQNTNFTHSLLTFFLVSVFIEDHRYATTIDFYTNVQVCVRHVYQHLPSDMEMLCIDLRYIKSLSRSKHLHYHHLFPVYM